MKPVIVTAVVAAAIGGYYVFSTQSEAPAPVEVSNGGAVVTPQEETQETSQPEATQSPSEQVETAVETATEAAEDAVQSAKDAVEQAGAAVDNAVDQAREALGTAGAAAADQANTAVEAAQQAADSAATAAADVAQDAAEAVSGAVETAKETAAEAVEEASAPDLETQLSPEGFDYDAVMEAIDGSDLSPVQKSVLKNAVTSAKDSPETLAAALDQVKAALGL